GRAGKEVQVKEPVSHGEPTLFTFSEALDARSVGPESIWVRDSTTGALLATKVRLEDANTVSVSLVPGVMHTGVYEYLVTPAVRTAEGRPLAGFLHQVEHT